MMKIAISSCLLGLPCRYDGKVVPVSSELQALLDDSSSEIISFCPEFATFKSSPRLPIRLAALPAFAEKYHIEFHDGLSVPEQLTKESEMATKSIALFNPDMVILKDGSPVCGTTKVDVNGVWKEGRGLLAQLLFETGFTVRNEENFNED